MAVERGMNEDDFYIGYEPEMPASMTRRVSAAAAMFVTAAIVVAAGAAIAQGRFAPGVFEFGRERTFEGRLVERPYPFLDVAGERYWLVGPGKRGAEAIVHGLNGRRVRVTGTLIERDVDRMIEIGPGAVQAEGDAVSIEPLALVGEATLEGEIVDSKCHLGVMKPGDGPTHRDCAVRCLLGGVPPLLVVTEGGRQRRVPLVSTGGTPLHEDLERWAARPVRITGTLYRRGDETYLAVGFLRVAEGDVTVSAR